METQGSHGAGALGNEERKARVGGCSSFREQGQAQSPAKPNKTGSRGRGENDRYHR